MHRRCINLIFQCLLKNTVSHLPSVGVPSVPHEKAAEVGESVDGEISGERCLLSLFTNDTDPHVGGLK